MSELYPGSFQFADMKIWKLPKGKEDKLSEVCNSGDYFGEVKKDGYWYEYEAHDEGRYLFSKNVSRTTGELTEKGANVPHILSALERVPPGTILIGEIYLPGGTSKNVTTIMGCLPEKAIARQKEGEKLHFYLHDIIYMNGHDLMDRSAIERYNILADLYYGLELNEYPYIELAEAHTENLENFIADVLAAGEEGVVLKKKDFPYQPGKRPAWSSIKVKKHDTVDVVIGGFEDATKEYNGKDLPGWTYWEKPDGGLIQGFYYDQESFIPVTKGYFYGWKTAIRIYAADYSSSLGTVSSGLTDELREAFRDRPEDFIGKVCEIGCMEKDSKEYTLRHPYFIRFRDDKTAEECTLENIF